MLYFNKSMQMLNKSMLYFNKSISQYRMLSNINHQHIVTKNYIISNYGTELQVKKRPLYIDVNNNKYYYYDNINSQLETSIIHGINMHKLSFNDIICLVTNFIHI